MSDSACGHWPKPPAVITLGFHKQFKYDGGVKNPLENENPRRMWGTCPNCSADLSEGTTTRPPYVNCPFCCAAIQPAWWQRVVWVAVGFFLAFAFPAWLGLTGWDVFFVGLCCWFPATVFAYILVFKMMAPKYVRQREPFTSLFHGHS
jgi:hypothetical protein